MKIKLLKVTSALLIASAIMIGVSAPAATIYQNTLNDLSTRLPGGNGIILGDEIFLVGTERALTAFSFEYWALNAGSDTGTVGATAAGISVQIRFYLNDGALGQPTFNGYPTPGTIFYDSGVSAPFSFTSATARNTLNFTVADFPGGIPLNMPVSSNFTWSVQFGNLAGTDTVGVDIYSPPQIGSSLNDYWQFSGGSWSLLTNATVNMNFAAQFDATVVPEPSAVVLGILGGLGILIAGRRLTRTKE